MSNEISNDEARQLSEETQALWHSLDKLQDADELIDPAQEQRVLDLARRFNVSLSRIDGLCQMLDKVQCKITKQHPELHGRLMRIEPESNEMCVVVCEPRPGDPSVEITLKMRRREGTFYENRLYTPNRADTSTWYQERTELPTEEDLLRWFMERDSSGKFDFNISVSDPQRVLPAKVWTFVESIPEG